MRQQHSPGADTGAAAAPTEGIFSLPAWQRPFASLRFRNYRLLWMGQFGSSMGQWMDQVSRGWLVYELTGSPFLLGAVTATRGLPLLFFGVLAGVVADRFGRKKQLVIAQTTNAFLNLVLAVLVATGQVQVWHIFVTGFLAGTVQAFQQPARRALISDLVGDRYIMNAIALNSAVTNISRSLGPALAGWLIALVGNDGSYFTQAVIYLFASLWTVQLRIPKDSAADGGAREGSMWSSMLEGFAYVRHNQTILMLLVLAMVPLLLAQPYTSLMPVFAREVLATGSQGLGMLFTAAGIGAACGALFIASVGNLDHKGWFLLGGVGLYGTALMGLSLSAWLPASMALLALIGFSNTSYNALVNTLLQTETPAALRGRVVSIYLLNRGLTPVGTLLAGSLATWFGAPVAVRLMGAACALLALWVSLKAPAVRAIK